MTSPIQPTSFAIDGPRLIHLDSLATTRLRKSAQRCAHCRHGFSTHSLRASVWIVLDAPPRERPVHARCAAAYGGVLLSGALLERPSNGALRALADVELLSFLAKQLRFGPVRLSHREIGRELGVSRAKLCERLSRLRRAELVRYGTESGQRARVVWIASKERWPDVNV